jgi:hypothetical protein
MRLIKKMLLLPLLVCICTGCESPDNTKLPAEYEEPVPLSESPQILETHFEAIRGNEFGDNLEESGTENIKIGDLTYTLNVLGFSFAIPSRLSTEPDPSYEPPYNIYGVINNLAVEYISIDTEKSQITYQVTVDELFVDCTTVLELDIDYPIPMVIKSEGELHVYGSITISLVINYALTTNDTINLKYVDTAFSSCTINDLDADIDLDKEELEFLSEFLKNFFIDNLSNELSGYDSVLIYIFAIFFNNFSNQLPDFVP